jgi:hypothetical protein
VSDHFIPIGHPYTAASVAKAFFDGIVWLHGIPCSIVSDQNMNMFWYELFRLTWVKLLLSSAFHPQTDGQSEVVNRVIIMYLRCLAGDRPKMWLQYFHGLNFVITLLTRRLLSARHSELCMDATLRPCCPISQGQPA